MEKVAFISHAQGDHDLASQLCDLLEARGLPCWVAPRDVPAGAPWDAVLTAAIDRAPTLVLILSAKANASRYVPTEVSLAFSAGKVIVPVRVEPVSPGESLRLYLARAQIRDIAPAELTSRIDEIADAIAKATASQSSAAITRISDLADAGRTPSPALVAAASSVAPLTPRRAFLFLTTVWLSLLAVLVVSDRSQLVAHLTGSDSAAVLLSKATTLAESFGYDTRTVDAAAGFQYEKTRPPRVSFWYKQASPLMVRPPGHDWALIKGDDDSVVNSTGLSMRLDTSGHLLRFSAAGAPDKAVVVAWPELFTDAGLDFATFTESKPSHERSPLSGAEAVAWEGSTTQGTDLRVEGEHILSRLAHFEVHDSTSARQAPRRWTWFDGWQDLVVLALIAIGLVYASHSWRRRYRDPDHVNVRGAVIIGFVTAGAYFLEMLLGAYRVGPVLALGLPSLVSFGVAFGGVNGCAYFAFEPWARRHSPLSMTTWEKVLRGEWRNPIIGHDILIASALAMVMALVHRAVHALLPFVAPTGDDITPFHFAAYELMGGRFIVADLIRSMLRSLDVLALFLILVACRRIIGRTWIAFAVFLGLTCFLLSGPALIEGDWTAAIDWVLELCLLLFMLFRYGLFAGIAFGFVSLFANRSLLTTHFTEWYGQSSVYAVGVLVILSTIAFRHALAGQRILFFDEVDERQVDPLRCSLRL